MKTVGDYKKAGLVFVEGDNPTGIMEVNHVGAASLSGCDSFDSMEFVGSFAWRTNTGLTPAFAGLVDAVHGDVTISGAKIDDLNWGSDVSIDKWRPHLPTAESKSTYDVDAHASDASGSVKVKVDIGSGVDTSRHSGDIVKKPSHYQVFDGIESIQIIASSMTEEWFKGFCFGNNLKYRLRAGGKDDTQQEIDKANFYKELFANHKHLCRKESL